MNEERVFIDYRHIISVMITLGFIACGVFIFPNAIFRLLESLRDLGLSVGYYFCENFDIEHNIKITVMDLPSWQIVDSKYQPLSLLPENWDDFKVSWRLYWGKVANGYTVLSYLHFLGRLFFVLLQVIVTVFPILWLIAWLIGRTLNKTNNDYDKESKAVQVFKRISDVTYRRIKSWIQGYICFLRDNMYYVKIWLCLWVFYFNAFTILIEFFAFYFYFLSSSFNFLDIYKQIYKLILDLTTIIRFVPGIIWAFCVLGILEYWARAAGYAELYHRELRNCGLVNSFGVLTIVYGEMGAGKTKMITDMALTEEVRLRDMALEVILEADLKFPNMNWTRLQQKLKKKIRRREVFSIPSVRRWMYAKYERWTEDANSFKIFGYDYERYGMEYNNGLEIQTLWQVMEDYACGYLIYTVQTSLLVANYSIRTDQIMEDLGNFPRWNSDFFRRDPRLQGVFSKYAHIMDFDMLRLGKRMVKENPNKYAFGFGVYVITEIDKERKNSLETKHLDPNAEEVNQRNDNFNALLKMARHAAVVANRVFIKIFADLQRPESLGADARELGNITFIEDPGEVHPTLPFFSPFYWFDTLFKFVFRKFVKMYNDYQFVRADKTLPLYIIKNIVAKCKNYKEKVCNTFGSSVVKITIESGRMDGKVRKGKHFMQSKKIYSCRFATDCLSVIFDEYGEYNTVGLDDMQVYRSVHSQEDEWLLQHSLFHKDVRGWTNLDAA